MDAGRAGPGGHGGRDALRLAMAGDTVHLGRLLAPLGVRYVVVDGSTRQPPGGAAPASMARRRRPASQRALLDQDDLQVVPGPSGVQVYENVETMPVTAQRAQPGAGGHARCGPSRAAEDVQGWQPVLTPSRHHHRATGPIAAGTLYAGYAPAGDFTSGRGLGPWPASPPSAGPASTPDAPAGAATLAFGAFPFVPLLVCTRGAGWVALAVALVGWRRRPRPRRRRRGAA